MDATHSVSKSLQYLSKFNPLRIDTTPNFVERLGCLYVTDFVAFYPNLFGSAMVYDNGVWEDDVDTEVWSAWASQPHVAGQLVNVDCFADPCEFHALVLNVITYDLYEADESLARDFLYKHYIDTKGLPLI